MLAKAWGIVYIENEFGFDTVHIHPLLPISK